MFINKNLFSAKFNLLNSGTAVFRINMIAIFVLSVFWLAISYESAELQSSAPSDFTKYSESEALYDGIMIKVGDIDLNPQEAQDVLEVAILELNRSLQNEIVIDDLYNSIYSMHTSGEIHIHAIKSDFP